MIMRYERQRAESSIRAQWYSKHHATHKWKNIDGYFYVQKVYFISTNMQLNIIRWVLKLQRCVRMQARVYVIMCVLVYVYMYVCVCMLVFIKSMLEVRCLLIN